MSGRTVFLDTSFIIALENRDDPLHAKAKRLDGELLREGCVLLLHWGIVLEIGDGYARLDRRAKGARLLGKLQAEEGYHVHPLTESLMQDALELYRSREDKGWGLTDCVSFVLMQQRGVNEALTADTHFRQAGFAALLL